ncbi:glutaredoxin family protein [Aneurinibacillus tyrosinisolvens]|jgi:glutaredoxin|uniref:glutaredoxin family protein n=1 Tax=Aneurinibacillus tyrosinisolvens TaxID=1443435 RepID=UPI00063F5D06|nr:glutaredoxin family protein [Aneurinibacillus tyrosinisolvens]
MKQEVVIYSTAGCIDCDLVKRFLKEENIPFEVRDVLTNKDFQKEVERYGFLGVPVTVVGQQAVKGYQPDELRKLLENRT